jgi:hypothetical protein
VALREGALIVNSSQGGGSKDTWVLAPEPGAEPELELVNGATVGSFADGLDADDVNGAQSDGPDGALDPATAVAGRLAGPGADGFQQQQQQQ